MSLHPQKLWNMKIGHTDTVQYSHVHVVDDIWYGLGATFDTYSSLPYFGKASADEKLIDL